MRMAAGGAAAARPTMTGGGAGAFFCFFFGREAFDSPGAAFTVHAPRYEAAARE